MKRSYCNRCDIGLHYLFKRFFKLMYFTLLIQILKMVGKTTISVVPFKRDTYENQMQTNALFMHKVLWMFGCVKNDFQKWILEISHLMLLGRQVENDIVEIKSLTHQNSTIREISKLAKNILIKCWNHLHHLFLVSINGRKVHLSVTSRVIRY